MKNKIVSTFALLAVMLGVVSVGANIVNAQTSSFPAGCSSALGYSATTGRACNGSNVATVKPLPGCTTALGYSATNGVPCSGASFAIFYLGGCTSLYGYSAADGSPCNGTTVATRLPPVTTPGLPTTGAGGNAFANVMLLAVSALIAVTGFYYLARKPKVS